MPIQALAGYRAIFGAQATPTLMVYDRGGYATATLRALATEGVKESGIQPKGHGAWHVAEAVRETVRSERGKTEGIIGTLKTDKYGFLSIFGDRLKSHIIYSSYTPRLHHVGEDKCFPHARASHTGTTVARTGLPWPATPRCMASDLPQGRAPSGRVPPLVARVATRPRRGSVPVPGGGRSVPDHRVGPPRSGG